MTELTRNINNSEIDGYILRIATQEAVDYLNSILTPNKIVKINNTRVSFKISTNILFTIQCTHYNQETRMFTLERDREPIEIGLTLGEDSKVGRTVTPQLNKIALEYHVAMAEYNLSDHDAITASVNKLTSLLDELPKPEPVSELRSKFYTVSYDNRQKTYNMNSTVNYCADDKIFSKMYNTDMQKHIDLIANVNQIKNKFLLLYYGEPGCGKTSFIKKLSNKLDDEYTTITIPTTMMKNLSDPSFASYLKNRCENMRKVILVLEDCEDILRTRTDNVNADLTSSLLNMIDGSSYFGDDTKVIFVCTFNTDLENVDPALLRPGRLLYKYEFTKLTEENATNLHKEIAKTPNVYTTPVTIADVFQAKLEESMSEENVKLMNLIKKINDL